MMIAGSVTVSGLDASHNPIATGSGMALAIYQGLASQKAGDMPDVPTAGQMSSPYSTSRPATTDDVQTMRKIRLNVARAWASDATGIAAGVVSYIKEYARVDLAPAYARVSSEKLGRTPDPLAAGVSIDPPSSPVHVPLHTDDGTGLRVN